MIIFYGKHIETQKNPIISGDKLFGFKRGHFGFMLKIEILTECRLYILYSI